jgi:adenine-specific DNA-methyltransferase
MEKLKMESLNMTQKNIEKIAGIFPNVITEMIDLEKSTTEKIVYKQGINFELLKQELMGEVIEGEEHYDFTWVGKKAAIVEGNKPIRKTLRPCIEESKDWENTGNLYIEGDNIDVLKLLQESYLNSVKLIYIDPPYNTGNDYIYRDNFTIRKDDYDEQINLFDENDNRLFKNTETNGRFHSDWCSMLYPRLKLASNLLSEDGLIFISIDDNEVANLRKIGNEIFGESNFVASIVWQKKTSPDARMDISNAHDYIIIYAKSKGNSYLLNAIPYDENRLKNYKNPDNDPRGVWASVDITGQTGRAPKVNFMR